jgi:hypothetical protein
VGNTPAWLIYGDVATPAQWALAFSSKQDDLSLNQATATALQYGINATGGIVAYSSASVASALGYTPLNPANNLSDVSSASSARSSLGLGSLATVTPGTGIAAALAKPAGALLALNPNFGGI